jgi:prephenate dehydratase
MDEPRLKKATAQLAKDCAYLKILGSYPNAE